MLAQAGFSWLSPMTHRRGWKHHNNGKSVSIKLKVKGLKINEDKIKYMYVGKRTGKDGRKTLKWESTISRG